MIIKRTNFSEADRILTVFTRDYGKIKIIAKGVRKITSRRCGNVEIFNLVELSLHKGKNFDILTEACVINSQEKIKKDLDKIAYAYQICEIIDGFCGENQESQKVFEIATDILNKLNYEENTKNEETINIFKENILKEMGFWPKNKNITKEEVKKIIEEILERTLKSEQFQKSIKNTYH